MDAPYQARDNTPVMRAGSGDASIRGMMPRKVVEVKRELLPSLTIRISDLNQRWPRELLESIDLINSLVVGISGGETLSARKPISNSVGITSSRPANSPQIVTGFPEASAMMMPSNRSIDGWVSS
jgi:hypothetical protein